MFRFTALILALLSGAIALAARAPYVVVDSISISGNKKTHPKIILRELPFRSGDTVALEQLAQQVEWGRQQILNTSLFKTANLSYKNWIGSTNHIHLHIEVEEMWYIYPIPMFELADRNFNVWWVDHQASLSRTNFGVDFIHQNLSGHSDRIELLCTFGYTHAYQFSYRRPYINADQTLGLVFDARYTRNREVNYITTGNKQVFFNDQDNFIYRRFYASIGAQYRPRLRTQHSFTLSWRQNAISSTIAQELNPDFFLQGATEQRYWVLNYAYSHDTRDVRPYPERGSYLLVNLEKDGLGMRFENRHALTLSGELSHFVPLGKKMNLALVSKYKYSLVREQQPYNDNRAIGFFGNNLAGYEYYIVDGLDFGILSTRLRFNFWKSRIKLGKIMPIESFRVVPFRLFLSFNSDLGYVNDPFEGIGNNFANRLLWGRGIGLDGVFFYDKLFRIEYSFNHLLERGLFFHYKMNL